MIKLSQNIQDYLKAIHQLSENGAAQTTDLADRLAISPASVTGMLKKLAAMNLVRYEKHRGVTLTTAGRKIALEVLRHHRLLELYLAEALGYTWDEVHDEAEKLEHHISEDFEDRIDRVLGNPQYDPHGDPIPSKDGVMPPHYTMPLSSIHTNNIVHVKRVSDERKPLLRKLREHGVGLNSRLTIVSRDDVQGTMVVRRSTTTFTLAMDECDHVFVE